ncbi:MAG: hypothetical protein HYS25_14250 [Ignavibacteriales bacterium]|nr:hypothetical protein [Ignavibacteriales bacterium]
MKAVKSAKVLTAVLILSITTNLFAQKPSSQKSVINQITTNSLYGLKSDYSSVVESTLFVILQVKNRYPNADYDKLIDRLNELAIDGRTPSIRYKAQLASLYYNYHDLFAEIKFVEKENPDKYFKMIAEKIESQSILAVN